MNPSDSTSGRRLRVLLVGNYAPDSQESMRRFAEVLQRGLSEQRIDVTTIAPGAGWLRWAGSRANVHRGLAKWLAYCDKFLRFPVQLRAAARKVDVVHICDHSNAMYGRWVSPKPWLVTCHDLLAVRCARGEFPEHPVSQTGQWLQKWILDWLNKAPLVVCDSHATAMDAARLLNLKPPRITTLHIGLNQSFQQLRNSMDARPVVAQLLQRLGWVMPQRFIFHVGGTQWYKNRDGVLNLFADLAQRESNLSLLIAGKPPSGKHLARVQSFGLEKRVVFLGSVTDLELEACYRAAEFLLFPSLAEGFGWPIIEAQACGCRVAASDRQPLPEVGGASVVQLPLVQREACLVRLLHLLEEEESERQARIDHGFENVRRFDPAVMLARYAALYREIVERDGPAC
jgi:glycosyltransferase involved in cell wall biosynthesis